MLDNLIAKPYCHTDKDWYSGAIRISDKPSSEVAASFEGFVYGDDMAIRKKLSSLPPSMAERAVWARTFAAKNPAKVDLDDEMIPWIYDAQCEIWISFDGNYSASSPSEKRQKLLDRDKRNKEAELESEKRIRDQYDLQMLWSRIRHEVLHRDKKTCQICFKTGDSKLHIHHIMKRNKGGTDHFDNLLTVCPTCHKAADGKLYDPDWNHLPDTNRK